MNRLSMPVQYVKGVGPKRASKLRRLNIESVEDLLYYFPRSYEDRRSIKKIMQCNNGEKVNLKVTVIGGARVIRPRKSLSIVKIPIRDSSGIGYMIWFNQDYMADNFQMGESLLINGKIKIMRNEIQILNPLYEKNLKKSNKIGRIVPIYPLTKGLSNNEMINIMENALRDFSDDVDEILPPQIKNELDLINIKDALLNIHFPQDRKIYLKSKKRLVFEELLLLQLGLFIIKNKDKSENKGIKFNHVKEVDDFMSSLPFSLTSAQKRVFQEIEMDMESERQMNRLIQGDVGSGKTIIAVLAMLKACKSGYQAVMMAPTEILATQHYESIVQLFEEYDIKCELLVGNISKKKKSAILEEIKSGDIDVLIGTHAIIEDNVDFHNLGLVITDEQHRFGVRQRALLSQKGENPDMLVMTATPIPRTLALILYGDLDISIIDELPPGRKLIQTYAVGPSMINRVHEFAKKQVKEGRQAYIVCPLVEESENLDIQDAENLYKELKKGIYKGFKVGLIHGRMGADEKDEIMKKFKDNDVSILISTTVIEVGVNVPNANIIIVYNAERFGLSQLHQLRGRVGRGEYQSYCILINESRSRISRERMKILESTNDGFVISEKDLELRGPGEILGTKQHGIPDLKIANLFTDMEFLKIAQREAIKILDKDPNLKLEDHIKIKNKIIKVFNGKIDDIVFN